MNVPALSKLGFKASSIPGVGVSPNMTASFSGFHISYHPYASHYGSDTTAIVLREQVFLILDGDHCKALSERASDGGIEGCIRYFAQNIGKANKLSEHRMVIGALPDLFSLRKTAVEVIGEAGIEVLVNAEQAMQSSSPSGEVEGADADGCQVTPSMRP